MPRRHPEFDDDDTPRRPDRSPDRSWSTKIAWLTLFGGAALVVTRISVATVVEVHGDGMAPTLLDGDHVVLLRERWTLERGDVVVYDPTPPSAGAPALPVPVEGDAPGADRPDGREYPDAREAPTDDLRNTAVVEREELEANWRKVQRKSDGLAAALPSTPLRLGRVLAVPGDKVTFHHPGGALGLAINGEPIVQKPSDPLELNDDSSSGTEGPPDRAIAVVRATAYETAPERRYRVLVGTEGRGEPWSGLELPPAGQGPVEIEAPGYLILADNRDEGACCDSRAIGWVGDAAIRGQVVLRLAASGPADASGADAPDRDRIVWNP